MRSRATILVRSDWAPFVHLQVELKNYAYFEKRESY